MMTDFGSTRSSRRRSKSRIKQHTEVPSDNAATPQHPSSLEVSDLPPHYMKATSCFEGKKGHIQASPHISESSFDSSDQSWSPSSMKSSSTLSSFTSVKILMNKSSSKSKWSNSNCQKVPVKSTCSSTLKDSKFPQHVEVHPGKSESDGISKMKICSYHHCSLNRRCDDPSTPLKRVFRRRRVLKSQKSIGLEGESTNADHFSVDVTSPGGQVHKGSNLVNLYADLVFGETSFPIDIMSKYSAQEQDTLVITTSKCCNSIEREWDESTSVSDDVESNDQSVTTPVFCNDEERDVDFNVITCEEEENINRQLSKNESFSIRTTSLTDDFVEAKCGTKFSSASASIARMELEESLQEMEKANPTEAVDPNASAKKLHLAQLPKEKHRSMWSLFHRHMISDESTELDSKVICGDDEEYHKDGCNKSCAAESFDSLLSFSERESMTTNQDANSQEVEARKLLAIKQVREAIERILLPELQDQSSDNQSVTSEVCTEENSDESDTKNDECDKVSKSDEGNITRENTGSPEKHENEERVTNKAEEKAPTHWSNLKRWILLQRFIKEMEKLRKFNPRKPQYLQLEPDPEAEKVNLKHQIEDERKSAEEWMLDYALQKVISQLAPTQKRKVGLLVTAFENVVPPQGSNIQVIFPKLKTRNEDNLQISDNVCEKYSSRLDKRNAEDDWLMLQNNDTQNAIFLCQKLDEVTSTLSNKVSIEEKAKQQVKEDRHSKLEREARINISKASHKKKEFGDSNDDSLRGTSSTISNLGNNNDETQENNMNLSECEAMESITASSDENRKITEAGEEDGTYRKQVNKQKHISMWHMISQQILSDIVSKVGSELLDGTDDEVDHNKTLAETNMDSSLHDFSEEKDDISHYGRSFSRYEAVNLIREAVSQILTTPTQDDSSDTQSVTSDIVQDEEPRKTDHTEAEKQNSTNSLCESLRHCDSQQTKELAANNTITKNKFEPPKSNNWSKLKKLILLKRSIKALERARKLNPQLPQLLLPPLPDQEQEKVNLRNQITDERRKAEQWMLDNVVQHMVSKLTPTRKTRMAMLVEAFEAVVPFPEV